MRINATYILKNATYFKLHFLFLLNVYNDGEVEI